jgi:DNA-binding transcriptional MerR regulator
MVRSIEAQSERPDRMMIEDHAMFTQARLADLAGVTTRRLRYWEETGLISPRVAEAGRGQRLVRMYDYTDALTVLILANLRKSASLHQIRAIVAHLRDRKFQVPEVKFALAGENRVFFQTPSGEWEDVRDAHQIVIHETLDLRPLRARLQRASDRDESVIGKTEKRRGALGSKPLVAGTRVPVEAVQRYLARGASDERILSAYPSLTPDDVSAVRALSA